MMELQGPEEGGDVRKSRKYTGEGQPKSSLGTPEAQAEALPKKIWQRRRERWQMKYRKSAAPDTQESVHRLREAITTYYGASGAPIPPPLGDRVTLGAKSGVHY
jgi:hypothetical protein